MSENATMNAFALSRSVLEHAPIGMLLATVDGEVTWANAALATAAEQAADQIVGRHLADYITAEDAAGLTDDVRTLEGGARHVAARDLTWRRPDGTSRCLQVHSSIALGADGRPLHTGEPARLSVIHQLHDVTDLRRIAGDMDALHAELERRNRELERSNEELAQFAYVASHDLSEPLRVISGHVDLLARRYGDTLDDDARAWIAFAVDGCARMRNLIGDLLRYSRAGATASFQDVALHDVLADVRAQLASLLTEQNAELIVTEPLPTVRGDSSGLTQLVSNLVSNGVKYGAAPARVRVSAEQTSGGWRLVVEDNGPGIPEHQRERVFRIFQRLHGREIPGTGIGLAICRKVAVQHGGRLTVADAPGGGCQMTLEVPNQSLELS